MRRTIKRAASHPDIFLCETRASSEVRCTLRQAQGDSSVDGFAKEREHLVLLWHDAELFEAPRFHLSDALAIRH